MATIYDVAAAAGVSISTVSLALNQPSRVSSATRDRVIDAARRLDFRPKSEAVSRARSGFGRIGVLAPFSAYASFHSRLDGILKQVAEVGSGLEVVVFDHESIDATESAFVDSLPLTERLDGLIMMGVPLSPRAYTLVSSRNFPVVLVDVGEPRFALPAVNVDDEYGGRLAASHLATRGRSSFAYIGIPQRSIDYVFQSQLRQRGFAAALTELGEELPPENIFLTRHTIVDAALTAQSLLETLVLPVGVFCFSDEIAAGVILAARRIGVRVPEDVAVIGFDNSDIAEAIDLTSIHQPLEDSGRQAITLLLEQIRGHLHSGPQLHLPLTLAERGSTLVAVPEKTA